MDLLVRHPQRLKALQSQSPELRTLLSLVDQRRRLGDESEHPEQVSRATRPSVCERDDRPTEATISEPGMLHSALWTNPADPARFTLENAGGMKWATA